ncbi:MAG: glycosyltransferase 61 family protein [Pseudomonadota bacterium]
MTATMNTAALLAAEQEQVDNALYRLLWQARVMKKHLKIAKAPTLEGRFWGDAPNSPYAKGLSTIGEVTAPGTDQTLLQHSIPEKDYTDAVPPKTFHKNVYYSQNGFAWTRGQLDQSLSIMLPRTIGRVWRERPTKPAKVIETGTIIACEHPYTYGDWIFEHLMCIAHAGDFPQPLVLPGWIGDRGYVKRDLDRLGIDYISTDGPVRIKNACVLHKQNPGALLKAADTVAFRKLFGVETGAPTPGRILYLSRDGINSDQVKKDRDYNSAAIAKIVEELGGQTIWTGDKGLDDYVALASEADIVIADHGAALLNMMAWHPRVVIEIFDDAWWSRCFVFLSQACGVDYHGALRTKGRSEDELRHLVHAHLANAKALAPAAP